MAAFFKNFTNKIFRRNRQLACTMHLSDPDHVHTDACFVEITPLQIVELYQSQGCKACPPALPTIHKALDANPNLLLLTYDVTYWDNSDWKDTFGQSTFDARQRAYVMKWGRTGIFTPHVIADGVADGVGSRNGEVADILAKARDMNNQQAFGVTIDRIGDELHIKSDLAEAPKHDVWMVSYDPSQQVFKIGKGTNKGKKVNYRNTVRNIQSVGEWHGGETNVYVPPASDGLERVVLVQGEKGGPIVSALKI